MASRRTVLQATTNSTTPRCLARKEHDNERSFEADVLLTPDEANMLTVLLVNRDFMASMRVHYPKASKQHFNMAVVSSEDNASDSDLDKE